MAYFKEVYVDDIIAEQIPFIREEVLKRDKDKVLLYDGREGTGKSMLAIQHASALDPEFNINKIAWNANQFIKLIKSPERKKGDCILLDEAFSAASSRAALSSVNKAMMAVATEMRQKNLFILIVLPSFFDLDRYFALWRCDTLFHVYFNKKGDRGQYVIFPFHKKQRLYLIGKKGYNYNCVKSPYPPCKYMKNWVLDETEYRRLKAQAFSKRSLSIWEKKWKDRTGMLIRVLHDAYKETDQIIGDRLGLKHQQIEMMRNGNDNEEQGGF